RELLKEYIERVGGVIGLRGGISGLGPSGLSGAGGCPPRVTPPRRDYSHDQGCERREADSGVQVPPAPDENEAGSGGHKKKPDANPPPPAEHAKHDAARAWRWAPSGRGTFVPFIGSRSREQASSGPLVGYGPERPIGVRRPSPDATLQAETRS